MRVVRNYGRHLPTFLAAFAAGATLLACGSDSDSPAPADPKVTADPAAGAKPDAGSAAPVYALMRNIYGPDDDRDIYVVLTNTLDVKAEDLTLDKAREFPGVANFNVIDGRVLVSSGTEPTITEYDISDTLQWTPGRSVSFAGYPLEDNANWYYQFVVSDTVAYMPYERSKRIVWNPAAMTLTGTKESSTLPFTKDGLLLESGGNRNGIRYDGPTHVGFFYHDDDWYKFGSESFITTYDPVTHDEVRTQSVPCPALSIATKDEQGYVYFSSWHYLPGFALYRQGPPPCAARLKPDGMLDAAWTSDLTQMTGGKYVVNFRYVGKGKAVGNVYDPAKSQHDFTKPLDPTVVTKFYEASPAWGLWMFDVDAGTAKPISGLEGEVFGSGTTFAVLDGRTFLLLPYEDESRSKIYELTGDGVAKLHVEVEGSTWRWVRVR